MTIYERIYEKLDRLLKVGGGIEAITLMTNDESEGYLKYLNPPFMPLTIEKVGHNRISMTHYYEQNGDLMADPDMEIQIYPDGRMAEALSFQQDNIGLRQRVYVLDESGKRIQYNPTLKKSLNEFLYQWLCNLEEQGFFEECQTIGGRK